MDVVDLDDEADIAADVPAQDAPVPTEPNGDSNGEAPYRAMDHASDTDEEIESIAEEDVAEEISQPRRGPRARRYPRSAAQHHPPAWPSGAR